MLSQSSVSAESSSMAPPFPEPRCPVANSYGNVKISVIIPVRNEDYCIGQIIEDLMQQTLPPDEIVITDGGSDDRTRDVIQSYIDKKYPIILICTDHAFPGRGRNLAISHARNDLVAMTDAGMRIEPNWLEKLYEKISINKSFDIIYGNYIPMKNCLFQKCASIVYVPAPELKNGRLMRHHFVASSLIKKRVWEEVGGFPDLRVGEDLIFMDKIERGGYAISYAPDAVVHWFIRASFGRTFRHYTMASHQAIRGGFWRTWHRGIVRMYAMGAVILALGFLHSMLWLLLAALMTLLRALKLVFEKRGEYPLRWALHPVRLFYILAIMLTIDLASLTGIIRWFLWDKLRLGSPLEVV